MTQTAYKHVTLDANGVARIDGTRMKVEHIVKEKMSGSATPDQLHEAYPHLTLAQIHAALAYYYDHQAEMDAEIVRDLREYDLLRAQAPPPPAPHKLRQAKRQP